MSTEGGAWREPRASEAVRSLIPIITVVIAVAVASTVLYFWPGSARESLTAPPAPYTQVLTSGYSFSFGRGVYDVIIKPLGSKLNVTLSCAYCVKGRNTSVKELLNVEGVTEVRIWCKNGIFVRIEAIVPPFHEHVADVVVRRVAP